MQEAIPNELSTEEKIKEAARKVFLRKGYAATRTRDIAEESGINLALINYYFRSKEKLFQQIMLEKATQLFGILQPIMQNQESSLDTKIDQIVVTYLDMLMANPDLPIFVLSEIRHNPANLQSLISLRAIISNSSFARQLREKQAAIHPIQFMLSMLGMCIFPFIAQPMIEKELTPEVSYKAIIEQRKKLLPIWIKNMIESEIPET